MCLYKPVTTGISQRKYEYMSSLYGVIRGEESIRLTGIDVIK